MVLSQFAKWRARFWSDEITWMRIRQFLVEFRLSGLFNILETCWLNRIEHSKFEHATIYVGLTMIVSNWIYEYHLTG